jgi:hypothetical protein
VYGPDWGSPVKTANFMVGRSGSVDHCRSSKDCIIGVLVDEDFSTSSAHNGVIEKGGKQWGPELHMDFLRRVLKKDHFATEFLLGSKSELGKWLLGALCKRLPGAMGGAQQRFLTPSSIQTLLGAPPRVDSGWGWRHRTSPAATVSSEGSRLPSAQ